MIQLKYRYHLTHVLDMLSKDTHLTTCFKKLLTDISISRSLPGEEAGTILDHNASFLPGFQHVNRRMGSGTLN